MRVAVFPSKLFIPDLENEENELFVQHSRPSNETGIHAYNVAMLNKRNGAMHLLRNVKAKCRRRPLLPRRHLVRRVDSCDW